MGVGPKGEIFFKRKDEELAWFDLRTQMVEELCYNGGNRFGRLIIYKETFFQFEEQVINYYSWFHQEVYDCGYSVITLVSLSICKLIWCLYK